MTDREARLIVLADYAQVQRKRVRHFWGTMGVVLRFDGRRATGTDAGRGRAKAPARRTAFETRAPRCR